MRTSRWTGNSNVWTTLLEFIVLLAAAMRAGADVVIVRSSDAAPYQQAEAAFIARLQSPQCKVRSVPVKQLADEGIGSAISTTDTVVAIGTPAATWLHNQLPEGILLVYCMVSNPEEAGLLKGTQCWGVAMEVAESEQFKLISEALPSAKTVGTLYRSDTPAGRQVLQNFKDALPQGWRMEAVAVNDFPNVAAAIDALMDKNVDVVWTSAAFKLYDVAAVRELLVASLRNKVPVWGFSPAFVRAGALLGVGVDPEAQARQATDLILKLGQSRQSVEKSQPPREYQIAINLVVADQLNIQIAGDLLKKATFIFRAEK
jgi:putative ABC transport system substrate-binding protein